MTNSDTDSDDPIKLVAACEETSDFAANALAHTINEIFNNESQIIQDNAADESESTSNIINESEENQNMNVHAVENTEHNETDTTELVVLHPDHVS